MIEFVDGRENGDGVESLLNGLLGRTNAIHNLILIANDSHTQFNQRFLYRLIEECQTGCLEVIKECEVIKAQIIKENISESEIN